MILNRMTLNIMNFILGHIMICFQQFLTIKPSENQRLKPFLTKLTCPNIQKDRGIEQQNRSGTEIFLPEKSIGRKDDFLRSFAGHFVELAEAWNDPDGFANPQSSKWLRTAQATGYLDRSPFAR